MEMHAPVPEHQGAQSLHDDFIESLQATGLMGYAAHIDMIQDGQLPDVKDDMRGWPMDGSGAAEVAPGLSDEDRRAGEALALAAQIACDEAITAAEHVKKRQKDSMENFIDDEVSGLATPSKRQKSNRRGSGVRSTEAGGRSGSKGLRHFSMKVCEKVEGKGRTTYNEVADELVNDLPNGNDPASPGGMQYDEKNIRRRVYDALNVLMAMGIITKEKKEIFWRGLPQGPKLSLDRLKGERQRLLQKLDQQRRYIAELTIQQSQYCALMHRNKDQTLDQLMLRNATGSTDVTALPLPFVLIQVDRSATIEIQIADDNRQAEFDFDASPFKITGDEQVLQEMSLVDTKDPMISRATNAATDALSPRSLHHSHGKLAGGSASNRAHPQLPIPIKNTRPNMASPPAFNLANLPHAAQLAALNMARGDPNILGSLAAAARGADWMRSPPGAFQGSPNFRLPTSPFPMLRPGLPNNAQPTLAQQLAMSLNPNGMLGSTMPGQQPNSPPGLLLAAASQPGGGLAQWGNLGNLGPHSNQGNHARLLHGSSPMHSNPGAPSGLTPGAYPLRPQAPSQPGQQIPSALNGSTPAMRPTLPQTLPQLSNGMSMLQPQGQPLKYGQDQSRPSLMNPPGSLNGQGAPIPLQNQPQAGNPNPGPFNQGTIGNSVLNAAWLSSFQKNGFPANSSLASQIPSTTLPQSQIPLQQTQQSASQNQQLLPQTQQLLSSGLPAGSQDMWKSQS